MAVKLPLNLWQPHEPFTSDHARRVDDGTTWLSQFRVAVVGLARNCGWQLRANLERMRTLLEGARDWRCHIEANDCIDDTLQVLADAGREDRRITFHYQDLGHERFGAEFAGPRTIAMAAHRAACQRWVASVVPDADVVIAIDFDQWGGWNGRGVLAGLGWLVEMPGAYGMTSVSLFQYDWGGGPQWAHYDLWALRGVGQSGCYFDTYLACVGGWAYAWFPPVGSPPVLVSSAFGGLAIYRRDAYLSGTYDGAQDCEHVTFHESIAKATGQRLYLCPAMRCVMHWLEDAPDARQHGDD